MIFRTAARPFNDEIYALLLEADPEKQAIAKYINRCEVFVLQKDEHVLAVLCAEKQEDNFEIKNIAVSSKFRRRGLGGEIIKNVCALYKKQGFKTVTVGTSAETPQSVKFYVKNGFKPYKTIKNFFTENYEKPIYDGETLCADMIVLKKNL